MLLLFANAVRRRALFRQWFERRVCVSSICSLGVTNRASWKAVGWGRAKSHGSAMLGVLLCRALACHLALRVQVMAFVRTRSMPFRNVGWTAHVQMLPVVREGESLGD